MMLLRKLVGLCQAVKPVICTVKQMIIKKVRALLYIVNSNYNAELSICEDCKNIFPSKL